jgi:alpha-L-fucosidase
MAVTDRRARDARAGSWFPEARFGLFIHWGIYALLGRGEQVLYREHLDQREYAALSRRFRAHRFDPDSWADAAWRAGMRYAVLTTKHHDGFCLFDSAVSDFTAPRTGAGRDLVREYVTAFRRRGLRVGLYYSLADWSQPAYFAGPDRDPGAFNRFVAYTHEQVRELCTNYGRVDLLWFDGGWPYSAGDWASEKLDRMVRRLQPQVMINDRLHGGGTGNVKPSGSYSRRTRGYFQTAEQRAPSAADRPVETERTSLWFWWGHLVGERQWKSPREVVHLLTGAAARGANLLLNVGPRADGTFPAPFRRILREVGGWMDANSRSIRGTSAGVLDCSTVGSTTTRGSTLYLHVVAWPGDIIRLYGLANRVKRVRFLDGGDRVDFRQAGLHLLLKGLPRTAPDPLCAVLAVEVEGTPREDLSVIRLWSGRTDLGGLQEWATRPQAADGGRLTFV